MVLGAAMDYLNGVLLVWGFGADGVDMQRAGRGVFSCIRGWIVGLGI